MATMYTHKNGGKTESAANTMTYENVEIPDTMLAKRVWIVRAELDCSWPEYVAAQNTSTGMIIGTGKTAPASVSINQDGVISSRKHSKFSTGAAQFACFAEGPEQAEGHFEVFKHMDGKFYFTIGILGVQNTAAGSCAYRVDFEIET